MNMRKTLPLVIAMVLSAGSAHAGATTLWIGSVVHHCGFASDDTIRVDVMLNSINSPIDLAGVGIDYSSSKLGFIRAERGALTAAWPTFNTIDVPIGPGSRREITIDAMRGTPIPAGISGQYATLVFVATTCGTAQDWELPLCVTQAYGDFSGILTACGSVRIYDASPGRLSVESIFQTCGSALGDTVEVDIRIEEASQPIDAAGVDVPYNTVLLEYVGYKRGDLTSAWPFFDAVKLVDVIRVGGFTPTPIPGGASGVFVTLRFVVSCCESSGTAGLCTQALVDDFAGMSPGCGDVVCVPLATRPSTWGAVKARYRQ